MSVFSRIAAITATVLFILTILGLSVRADTNRAAFPKNFDKFVLYATFDRGSSKEEAFATPETIELSRSGKPLPAGTQLVLGIWTVKLRRTMTPSAKSSGIPYQRFIRETLEQAVGKKRA